jgi:hypothetical protein
MTNKRYFNEKIYEELKTKYGKLTLTKQDLSEVLDVSVSLINHYITKGYGIPEYIKVGSGPNGSVRFPVVNVVDYLSNTIKVS